MERDDIQEKIDAFTNLINRDAGYTRPEIRVVAEQALAAWVTNSLLAEIVRELQRVRPL